MINTWLRTVLFQVGSYELTYGGVMGCILSLIVVLAVLRLCLLVLIRYRKLHEIEKERYRSIKQLLYIGSGVFFFVLCLLSLRLEIPLLQGASVGVSALTIRNILIAGLIIVIARIADKVISSRLLEELSNKGYQDLYRSKSDAAKPTNITRIVQYMLITLVGIFLLNRFGLNRAIHTINVNDSEVVISIASLLWAIFIIFVARLLLWIIVNVLLYGWYKSERIDVGKQFAYNQLLSYIVYFFAVIFALDYIGIDLTILLAGAAALLVGVGIALQQVISDFFSGLVILFERSVEVGDYLDFGEYKGVVKKIGLRASIIQTQEHKEIILPNSFLVNDKVTNWSSPRRVTRFVINVGVSYGSDTEKVKDILLEVAANHRLIVKTPKPFVRFEDFGNSALAFTLFFFSDYIVFIEDVQSELRFEIDKRFREEGITIPFPQRDVWIHNTP